jgi:hypothetical protein
MQADQLRKIVCDEALMEIGRKAIEDALIEWRDARLSELARGNGLVIREANGEPSNIIRFGPELAVSIALGAIADHLNSTNGVPPSPPSGCEWHKDDDGIWKSACGAVTAWCFDDGGPEENGCRFCLGCGKPLVVADDGTEKTE